MKRLLIICGIILVPIAALAQDATVVDPGALVVGWVCSNQTLVSWAIGLLIAHTGLSITSATLKKLNVTVGPLVQIIRFLAIDVKPPPSAIVQQSATILANSPDIVAQTQVNPARISAAADAIKNA